MSFSSQTAITKMRAMYGKMLKEAEYLNILNCNKIEEVIDFLKNNTHYKNSFNILEKSEITEDLLEDLIKREAFLNYKKIYRYANKNKVIEFFIKHIEIDEILKIMLIITGNKNKKYLVDLPQYLVSKCKIKLFNLVNVKTFDDLLETLKNTKYEKLLLDFKQKNKEINYLKFEHILYEKFFKELLKTVKAKTKNVELFELNKLIKTKIDNINLCYIYREKTIFKTDSKKIKENIFNFHKNLTPNRLEKILASADSSQLEENFKEIYKNIKNFKLKEIEKYAEKTEFLVCQHYINLSLNLTTVFYCFYILQQIEIKNLIHIIEGIRYNLKKEEIKNYLTI